MQIERFAVGNFQFSSPCCQHASRPPQTRRRYCPSIWIPEKQTWNWFSVAAFRFDSIRFDSFRSVGWFRQKWVAPACGFLLVVCSFFFLFGGIHTFSCSFVRVDGLLIIFCSDAFSFVDNYAISRQRTFTDTTNFKSHQFPSFPKIGLKQLTFGLSNCESSGTRISS